MNLAFRQIAAGRFTGIGVFKMKQKFLDLVSGRSAVVALSAALPVFAFAQSTDPFDTAITTATTKVTSYAGALVTLSAVAVVFMIGMKYVKRIPRAS